LPATAASKDTVRNESFSSIKFDKGINMSWEELCNGETVTGKQISLETIYGPDVDHNKRGKTGMPDAAILRNMVASADGLELKKVKKNKGKGEGISFHVASCAVAPSGGLTITTKLNVLVDQKRGAAECYENRILPMQIQGGHVLVHQSVAPCLRCRAGYKAWAKQRGSTIVVSADVGYDGSGDNKVFICAPTGLVFFG
jgi:hypothetical protein